MKLTTKGRYAVTAILDLVVYGGDRPVNLNDISTRQKISLSYLEQLFTKLRRQGVVESVRGPGGGYKLVCSPSELTVAAVIDAVGERVQTSRCEGDGNCREDRPCLTHQLWYGLDLHIRGYLDGINFSQLAAERLEIDKDREAESVMSTATLIEQV